MNELIQSLQEKTGITADQAKAAVDHIMEWLKAKVPASLQENLDLATIGNTIKTKGSEFLAQAQSGGGDLLKSAEEKISGFLHSKEA
jgi:nucleoid DNA-binding protein